VVALWRPDLFKFWGKDRPISKSGDGGGKAVNGAWEKKTKTKVKKPFLGGGDTQKTRR